MESECCGCCKHFQQHYALQNGKLFRVYCGRCLYARPKRRFPDAKVCENYIHRGSDTAAFATVPYLTKELLKYVLSLPLLPEIEEESPS